MIIPIYVSLVILSATLWHAIANADGRAYTVRSALATRCLRASAYPSASILGLRAGLPNCSMAQLGRQTVTDYSQRQQNSSVWLCAELVAARLYAGPSKALT
ncbi:hypothetical protein V1505DRAFT_87865 [Lipomyces doorenjongii]